MTIVKINADRQDVAALMAGIGRAARDAATALARVPTKQKDAALLAAAMAVRANVDDILTANADDVADAVKNGLAPAMIDRLTLDTKRVEAIARALEDIAALPDPVGAKIAEWDRPNVTADAGALCLKSGNAAILRGGSEALRSSKAIHASLLEGIIAAGLPEATIQLVPVSDRAAVGEMLRGLDGNLDVIVPRGGKSLVARVQDEARVPVFAHLEGVCHVYVDRDADLDMARNIVLNSKMRRTGICGAAETLLVDAACAATHLKPLVEALLAAGCEVRGDTATQAVDSRVRPATEEDWYTEYLDAIIAVRVVKDVEAAMAHIARYGSAHTEAIVTGNAATAERFLATVDSAILLHNASTQFADGGEFGMGAEIGIATGKFHARGPVGVEQLTSFKYAVRGNGQVRP